MIQTISPLVVQRAEEAAAMSPCMKSKRGVVIFVNYATVIVRGFNGPPEGWTCTGSEECRANCGKRCVHAEMRALRKLSAWDTAEGSYGPYQLLHVKIDEMGKAVAGGPPSCYTCSREILDSRLVKKVWLYEALPYPAWISYTPEEFHEITMLNCGIT